jgi:uracil-DNA glycosylase family 4
MTDDPAFPTDRHVLERECERCPSLVDSRTCISWGTGPADAAVMVVGEAPGAGAPETETWRGGNHTGMAYTTRHSGRRIRRLFSELGYDPYYTNAVKCFPSDGTGSNREPEAEERENCRTHLLTEIERVKPEVVVATGKHATQSLLAAEGETLDGFLDSVLEPRPLPTLGTTLLPLLHPSYQEVWLSRLGLDSATYRERIAAALPPRE